MYNDKWILGESEIWREKIWAGSHLVVNIWWDGSSRPAQNNSYNSLKFTFLKYMIRPHNSSIENCHKCHFKLCVNCTSKEHGCALLEHEVINCRQNVWFFKRPNSPRYYKYISLIDGLSDNFLSSILQLQNTKIGWKTNKMFYSYR